MRAMPTPTAEAALDVHIASFVVHVVPRHVLAVAADVAGLAGAEVHAATPEGKLIVTLESIGPAALLDAVASIQRMPGVINAALVYQCADTPEAMNEELPDAHSPQGLH